ncbi:MAG: hypothetical protein CMG00_05930 [Candidatus Marinimicrobia bacterium]|nr:hypothetical protein [Candidatus Neomarinimicrobiota bacterium]|tara:strand:+ start:2078 stop:2320 length:243 start_codon:yes stop_codon:yes gene_type:complete
MLDIKQILIITSLLGCILGVIGVILSMYAIILAKSLEKATHSVQFMPVNEAIDPAFSNQKDIVNLNEEQKEENEDEYRMV